MNKKPSCGSNRIKTTPPPYHTYQRFLRDRYGTDVYRVPLDLGFGCPYRDATTLKGGCIFCGEHGSRASQLGEAVSIEQQVRKGVAFARERYGARAFLAYFQAYTSTHAPPEILRDAIRRVNAAADFRGFIFGTRPDCLSEPILDVLQHLAQEADVWVELGIQTAHDATLELINRGHDAECSRRAAFALAERGIHVAAHVILGLPGETQTNFHATAAWLRHLPVSGIKIHNLHIVKGTLLAQMWREQDLFPERPANDTTRNRPQKPFPPRQDRTPCASMTKSQGEYDWEHNEETEGADREDTRHFPAINPRDEHEYGEVLIDFLRRIPAAWPVMRLVSDTPADLLLAPKWWMSKPEFLQYIDKQMRKRGLSQGDLIAVSGNERNQNRVRRGPGAEEEIVGAPHASMIAAGLADAVIDYSPPDTAPLRVLDIGLGGNWGGVALFHAAARPVDITCMTPDPGFVSPMTLPKEWQPVLESLLRERKIEHAGNRLALEFGDPRPALSNRNGKYDVILLEPGNIERAPQFHTVEFCRLLAEHLNPAGILVSPSSSNLFRAALCLAGFNVGTTRSSALRRGGTLATMPPREPPYSLNARDKEALASPASRRPYRDPNLNGPRREILRRRAR